VLKKIPATVFDYVFVDKVILPEAELWYKNNKGDLLVMSQEEDG
jgi:hypothetical protein